ncbi:threonine/serine ThrE exporter family protein, partial [Miniimonas arenae]|uniref:threonine/serine ThrE exporter family protein n=1 Tax=Miniimonas arenae TaxID=676201 RepID=UPI0028AC6A2C
TPPPGTTPPAHGPASEVAFLVLLGEALIDCASPIAEVQRVLVDVAEVHGFPEAEIIALPTAVLVTLPGTSAQTAAATAGGRSFRLDQVEDVVTLAEAARTGEIGTAEATARLRMIGLAPAPYSEPVLVAGYAVYSVGLSLILGGGWLDLLVVAGLGVLVALVRRLTSARQTYFEALVVLSCAFGTSVVSLGLARLDVGVAVLPTLVPPIVMFLPGALLTTGVIDLATRQMIAGAARLAAGAMQTVLLAVGVAAAASLVGVRATVLDEEPHGVGVLGPWLGVVLFTAGVGLYHCVRRSALPWVLLVVTVAYAGELVGGLLFGGVVSALVGAMAMTPVALYAASVRGGPPALVSFLPGFWVLLPGALALVGLTETFTTSTGGATSLLTAGATMVAVSLGVLVGLALHALGVAGADRLRRPTA